MTDDGSLWPAPCSPLPDGSFSLSPQSRAPLGPARPARSFYLRSWVEDDGLFLWFATEGDDTHNLLLDTESGAWSLIEGEAHEPRGALAGQFLAFEKDDLDVDLSVGHRFDPESSTWTPLPPLGAPLLRRSQLEVATDRGYFVWGGNGKVADTDEYSLLAEG